MNKQKQIKKSIECDWKTRFQLRFHSEREQKFREFCILKSRNIFQDWKEPIKMMQHVPFKEQKCLLLTLEIMNCWY